MCGIAGFHRLSDLHFPKGDHLTWELLSAIESRGTDATGYAWIDDDGALGMQKASCTAKKFNPSRNRIPADARTVILHTRWATQGPAWFAENNHPVVSGSVYAVHNGHIWNDSEVFRDTGKTRRGQVDSEAISALVYSRGFENIEALGDLDGDMAVAMFDAKQPGSLILARGNSSPLYYARTKHLLVFASTFEALRQAWSRVLGTPPDLKRSTRMGEGDALIVRGSSFERGSFTPGWSYTPATSWKTVTPSVAKLPAKVSKGWIHKEGTTNGTVYTGMVNEDVTSSETMRSLRLADPDVDASSVDIDGIDCVSCDDCCDWFPVDAMSLVKIPLAGGIFNLLCPKCEEWAKAAGLTHSEFSCQ